jgi:hypothetical protein
MDTDGRKMYSLRRDGNQIKMAVPEHDHVLGCVSIVDFYALSVVWKKSKDSHWLSQA